MKNKSPQYENENDIQSPGSLYDLMPNDVHSREILKKRSHIIAEEVKTEEIKTQQHGCISINLGTNDKFGLSYTGVIEICPIQLITPIPQAAKIVMGITNWRGKIIAVISLAKLLWGNKDISLENGKLIIISNQNLIIALLVHDIIESFEYEHGTLSPPLPLKGIINPEYISGINQNCVAIINIETIFEKLRSDIIKWRTV